jgi:FkbH-like protein
LEDPSWISRTVSLSDRFGDNGLISVLLACMRNDALEIDTWLMSCRVLKRGVEQFLLNHLCSLAQARGLTIIRGEYIPTAKNAMVRDHYAGLGFTQAGGSEAGRTYWELQVGPQRQPLTAFIEEKV